MAQTKLTEDEFETMFENYDLEDAYAEYIMDQTPIGNGDMLILAMESGRYFDGFKERMTL